MEDTDCCCEKLEVVLDEVIVVHFVVKKGARYLRLRDVEALIRGVNESLAIKRASKECETFKRNTKKALCVNGDELFIGEDAWLTALKKTEMEIKCFIRLAKLTLFQIPEGEKSHCELSSRDIVSPSRLQPAPKRRKTESSSFLSLYLEKRREEKRREENRY